MINMLFTLGLFLWSDVIGPEIKPFFEDEKKITAKVLDSPKKIASTTPKVPSIRRPLLKTEPQSYFDKEQFRAAFVRQSSHKLLACLKNWQSSPQTIWVKGTLNRMGQMSGLVSLDSQVVLPPCVHEAVGNMSFSSVVAPMTVESTNVHWRIDW